MPRRFAKVTIGTAVDNGTTYFRFCFNGKRSYYMFCNDGTIAEAKKIKDLGLCDIYRMYVGAETVDGFDPAIYMDAV